MNDLRHRPHGRRPLKSRIMRNHRKRRYFDLVENCRTASGCALTKARPVINYCDAGSVALDEHDHDPLVVILCHYRHPMGKQRARRVELLTAEDETTGF